MEVIKGDRDDSDYPQILSGFNEHVDNALMQARRLESLSMYDQADEALTTALMSGQNSDLKPVDLRQGLKKLVDGHRSLAEVARDEVQLLSAEDFGPEYGMLRELLGEDEQYNDMPEVTSIVTLE